MNRLCTLSFLLFFGTFSLVMGQQKSIDFSNLYQKTFTKPSSSGINFRMEMDTLLPPAFDLECANQVSSFSITDNWGNVSGMNQFMDLQKAQRFNYDGASTYQITEIGVFFSRAQVVGDGELKINIYDVGVDGSPGNILGSSNPINVSNIAIPGEDDPILATAFSFESPVLVEKNQFFVSVDFTELYASQDTVAFFNTPADCGDGTSAWEQLSDGSTWANYVSSWSLNSELGIIAVVEKLTEVVLETIDTAYTPSFQDTCGRTVTFFGVQDGWGYVGGTNSFGDLEKAQRFDFAGGENYNLTEVFVFFHDAIVVGDGEVTVKIYDVAGDGSPGDLLGTSLPLTVSQLVTSDQTVPATQFLFESPVPLASNRFFASVDLSALYTSQDTVGIWHTRPDCGTGTSTWELFSDGTTWVPFTDQSSWQFDTDLFIFAVLELMTVDVDDISPEEAGLHLKEAYPNPAQHQITIDYRLDQNEEVNIQILQSNGQLVRHFNLGNRGQGDHREVLDITNLSEGIYFYTFTTGKVRVARRFVVQR